MNTRINKIVDRGKAKNSTRKDEEEMLFLFHQPEKEQLIKEKLLNDLQSETQDNEYATHEVDALFSKIWLEIEKNQYRKNKNKRNLFSFLKIAIVLIIGLYIGSILNFSKNVSQEPIYYEARAPKGSIIELILPDKSIIYLNADSKVKYSVNNELGVREVFLSGEAWFDIAKNEAHPFIVHTPFYKVNVTGTKFNVKTYESDNSIITTLEEGEIILLPNEAFKLKENVILAPGEQAILSKNSKELTIRKVNTRWYTSWKDNKLIFVNMNLKDLVTLLERKYGVEIEVKNKDILDLHFDGTIKNESILEFLEIIKSTLPINYKIIGQKIEITSKN
ncbi:MAG: FecR family protein [Prolixibacteraceae bacterium]|nr:FecR family protein [Prolixibacteraceae bacterium]